MSDITHTPGPWKWDDTVWSYDKEQQAPWLVTDDNKVIPIITGQVHCSEANARLIAAAPDAMRALVRGYYCLADIHNQWPGRHLPAGQKLLCDMRDSIAKALGMSEEEVSNGAAFDYGAS